MLIDLIENKYRTVSIVGMAKNSGKTVTLNHLISEAMDGGIPIGITSIGRDGERLDVVTETEKPRIFVEEGTYIATAKDMLNFGDANIEILQVTEFRTPLGEIVLGRVRDKGYVQLAGPQLLSQVKEVADMLLNYGAEFVVVDGALGRVSSAAPTISEATILATGAVVSRDMPRTIEETKHLVGLFNLPTIKDQDLRPTIEKLMDENKISIIDESKEVSILPLKTALSPGNLIGEYLTDQSRYLIIPGSLVKKTIEDLTRSTRRYKNIEIIVRDGTKIFINPRDWTYFKNQGIGVRVLDKINLVALTLNPYSPEGYYYNPMDFLEKTRSEIKDIRIIDLILGGE